MRYQSPIAQALSDNLGGIANTLVAAPGPADLEAQRLKNAYLQSGIDENNQKVAAGNQKLAAASKLGDLVRTALTPQEQARPDANFVGPMPQMSQDQAFRNALPGLIQYGTDAGITNDLPALNLMINASGGASNEATDRAQIGAGAQFGDTREGFGINQQGLTDRNAADNTRALQTNAADNARALEIANLEEGGRNKRFNVNTPANTITTLAPDNPLGVTKIEGMDKAASGSQTPRNYVTPDGKTGMTYDGQTDIVSGAALPQGTSLAGTRGLGGATEYQGKAAGYALRMEGAMKTLAQLPKDFDPTSLGQFIVADTTIPLTGVNIGNYVADPQYMQFLRAARDLAALILRGDSGAAVTADEIRNYGLRYLPAPGDPPAVLKDKADAIARAYGGFAAQAGPALKQARSAYADVMQSGENTPAYIGETDGGSGGGGGGKPIDQPLDPNDQPEDSKVVNGIYYEKHGGQWYQVDDDGQP